MIRERMQGENFIGVYFEEAMPNGKPRFESACRLAVLRMQKRNAVEQVLHRAKGCNYS